MKILISCTENPNFFIEVLDELELFIDNKVIFDKKKNPSVRRAVCRSPYVSKFCNPHNFFPFNLDTSPFQVKFSKRNLSPIVFQAPGADSVG
jgi:hypothetical protein